MAVCFAAVTFAPPAVADDALEVVGSDGHSWAERIAWIHQTRLAAGTSFRVIVVDRAARRALACGAYSLAFDAIAVRALRFGACNPADGSTEVILVDRTALFAAGDPVPVPLAAGIVANVAQSVRAVGGANAGAGIEFHCNAWVRPFVRDLLNGGVVYLSPDRFVLEPLGAQVQAAVSRGGWALGASGGVALADAAFRVVDRVDGHEVTRDRVSLSCRSGSASEPTRAPVDEVARLPHGAVGRGRTTGATSQHLGCAESDAPMVRWTYTAPYDGTFEFLLQGGYDVALEVRDAETNSMGCSSEDGIGTHARVVARLTRGSRYTIDVGGEAGEAGAYEVAVIPIRPDVEIP